ncbi:hypothetical protein EDD18DRAFT_1200495 [Armillaria luteobubalina]|uniref:Uncharacterized protein n=1 Tax=Armillaria luteobubalina TaxID=153913 RepID=A0AA39PGT7_9AGAR|nr:hypothetical protein EDD18DRAFT_1200495 [Armillaria luteobubalina]
MSFLFTFTLLAPEILPFPISGYSSIPGDECVCLHCSVSSRRSLDGRLWLRASMRGRKTGVMGARYANCKPILRLIHRPKRHPGINIPVGTGLNHRCAQRMSSNLLSTNPIFWIQTQLTLQMDENSVLLLVEITRSQAIG